MKRRLTWLGISALLLVAACGDPNSGKVPTPTPPPSGGTLTTNPPTVDPRLPDLSKAVTLDLIDKSNYSGLQAISNNDFHAPLIGAPLVVMALVNKANALGGNILVSFEDQYGFWGAQLPSFDGTGTASSSAVDVIFADDSLVLRVKADRNGDTLKVGHVYYRVRQATDLGTECKKVTVTCSGGPCDTTPPDVITPCKNYITPGNANVTELGTFEANYSTWVTQQ